MKAPSERKLLQVEGVLRKLAPGAQRAVGNGIYMRLDRKGDRRFLLLRRGGQPGGTYDSWQAAIEARETRAAAAEPDGAGGPSVSAIRDWSIERYAQEAWWPTVELHCSDLTQIDYRRGLKDLLPHVGGITLAQLETSPLLVDALKQKIVKAKTFPAGHRRAGELPKAAADKPLKAIKNICGHAEQRQILLRNPLAGVQFFNSSRSAAGPTAAPSHQRVMQSEVKHPRTIMLAASGMRGDPLTIRQRRLIPKLIGIGYRPSDILAMRNRSWRDENGRRRVVHIDSAVKNLGGHLIEGEPKTGPRDIYLFESIAEELEQIYQLQGCPSLDALTIPNAVGGLLDWGNWRTHAWYPALHRAGLTDAPRSDAAGDFWPYKLRHVGVTIMLHAQRPEGGTYSEREVARQFGHTVGTLDRVYADIPEDMHGIAGMTMDEILRNAQREVWGPMPGDPDYNEIEYDLVQAAALTGINGKALAGRLQRGSVPGAKRQGKWYVTHFDLAWHGLLPNGLSQQG